MAEEKLADGQGYAKLLEFLQAQGGNTEVLERGEFLTAPCILPVTAAACGYVAKIDAAKVAAAVQHLGAGRQHLQDKIDHRVGVILAVQPGDKVIVGQKLADVYAADEVAGQAALAEILASFELTENMPQVQPLIYGIVTEDGSLLDYHSLYK